MAQTIAMPSKMGLSKYSDILISVSIVGILLLMIIPLPTFMLDALLILSITWSLFILLIGIYIRKPLDFSIFPTILLLATFFRLSLNVASTRLILINGSQGHSAAGHVIESFGKFVAGSDEVVGFVMFLILNIINFIVITKGSGRVSEVSARFTLDAMPGKQLAIDADLNAGIINEKIARERREEVQQEADFYGSMDGASKFVRGDAIAGIMIAVINIVGGLIIGMVKGNMTFTEALSNYTILTIGDGLVSQVPALIVSFAAGIVVTKVTKDSALQSQLSEQIFSNYRPIMITAIILFLIAIVPGMPNGPLFIMSMLIGGLSWFLFRKMKNKEVEEKVLSKTEAPDVSKDNDLPTTLDVLEIEVGYDLVPLVNNRVQGDMVKRILALRKQFAQELGVIVPPIHIQDNLQLRGNEYRILLKSVPIAKGELLPGHYLALESGRLVRTIDGIPTKEPTYGLPALWIPETRKEDAIIAGYTVVDLGSILATHLSELLRRHSHEIFNRQDLQTLLDEFKKAYPKVVGDLIPDLLPFGTVLKVMQNLLRERVPIRDFLTILETLAEQAVVTKDPLMLTEAVRQCMGRLISSLHQVEGEIRAVSIDKVLEDKLGASVEMTATGPELHVDPVTSKALIEDVQRKISEHAAAEGLPIILCSQGLRAHLFHLLENFVTGVVVLSHNEVAGNATVRIIDTIGAKT